MRPIPANAAEPAPTPIRRRWLRASLGLAGAALVITLIARRPGADVGRKLFAIAPLFALLVALYMLAQLAFCLGWWTVLSPRPAALSFPRLFSIYLAGDCVNYVSPGNVGGEPVRGALLARTAGGVSAAASVVINRYAELCAQCLFVTAGLAAVLWHFRLPAGLTALVATGTVVLLGFLLLFGAALTGRAPWRWLSAIATRFPVGGKIAVAVENLSKLENELSRFQKEGRLRFLLAAGFCFTGWCGGLFETFLILRALSPRTGVARAIGVEILCMLANSALPFVPAKIGTAEAVRVSISGLVGGLSPSAAVVYAVTRRGREVVWAVFGAVALAAETSIGRTPAPTEPA